MAEVAGGVVGAGTLLTPADVKAAKAAGARFGVSPGVTDALVAACEAEELPLLGGIATVGEAMRMLERGYEVAKFFPAEANGGAPALKSFAGPLPQMSFCPTGGVTPKNAPDYLKLPNVLCVGGSWVAEASLLRDGPLGRGRRGWRRTPASWRGEIDGRRTLAVADRGRRRPRAIRRILSLFERDPDRFNGFSVRLGDMLLDFSKTAIDARALTLLIELAAARGVPERRDLMFTGAKINTTEDRAVLHVALRNRSGKPILVDGRDVMPEVDGVLDRMAAFADGVRSGRDRGHRRRHVHRRRQHRHRRLRPRAGDGDAGAGALPRRAALALRLERRRGAYPRHARRGSTRSGRSSSSPRRPSPPSRR